MNELMLFENEQFGKVRTTKLNGQNVFVAKDIAVALGYLDPLKAISTHCKGVVKMPTPTNGGVQNIGYIKESDVYRLIIRSKLPSAEQFEQWLFEQVLPQIRQTGGYIPVKPEDDEMTILAKAVLISQKTIEKKDMLIAEQQQTIEYQQPLVELAKKRLDRNGLLSITDATQTFELRKGKITRWAKQEGYLHKTISEVNEKGKLYFKVYDSKGYRCIGVTEEGLHLISEKIEQIKGDK